MTGSIRRHEDYFQSLIDKTFVCLTLFALFFNVFIGPLTPIMIMLCVTGYLVLRRDRLPKLLACTWPVLLLPILALLSAIWSVDPPLTIKSGILYLLTIFVATIFGGGIKHRDFMAAIFFAFLVFAILSLLFGNSLTGARAFQGLLASKNEMGEVAGVLVIASTCAFAEGISRGKFLQIIFSVLGLLVGATELWFSQATTATIATVTATFCAALWLVSIRLGAQTRTTVFISTILTSILVFIIFKYWGSVIFDMVLENTGKDTTLTGRTDLWRVADRLIAERPWLGMGYNTFWRPGNLEAEALWRAFGIEGRSGFNFHNTYREITVALGFVGFTIYLIVAVIGALSLLLGTMRTPSIPLIFLCALLISSVIKLPFEAFGFGAMQFFTVLSFATISAGYTMLGTRRKEARAS